MDSQELQRIRAVPLEAVLEGFGAQRDPKDPKRNWRVGASRITVTGDKYFDHNEEKGGGGALDLTLHLLGRDPRHPSGRDLHEAAAWLGAADRARQATQRAQARAVVPTQSVTAQEPPVPDPSRLTRVRWYLTDKRGLPAALVDRLIDKGSVFADSRANVVFRLRDEAGRDIGFEKRGTYDKPFHSVHGDKGLFFAGSGAAQVAAFVESGIEALSYKALYPAVLAISTTGNAIELPEKMGRHLLARGFKVMAAFNADGDGDRFAERFAERLGGQVQRHRPQGHKDWNLVLRAERQVYRYGEARQMAHAELTR
jgi:hypothetical protein